MASGESPRDYWCRSPASQSRVAFVAQGIPGKYSTIHTNDGGRKQPFYTYLNDQEVLQSYPAEHMFAYPVSARVSSPKSNDARLIGPLST